MKRNILTKEDYHMKTLRLRLFLTFTIFIVTVIGVTLYLSTGDSQSASQIIIKVDGSSTVYPITEAVAEEFQKVNRKVKVTVGISGTGGGFKKFCRGETDISNASRPIKPVEVELAKSNGISFIELPVAFDGLAVIVNKQNTWAKSMTVGELKKLWEPEAKGRITKWSHIRKGWPDEPIRLFGPGTDSGTFDYFTEVICGKEDASRPDYTASEDDNVLVQGIASDKYALGYLGLAYYEQNADRLNLVAVDSGKGPILPNASTVSEGTYAPLSRPIFIYVSVSSLKRPAVKEFVEFYLRNAKNLSGEVGYIPLPEKAYTLALERVAKLRTGTSFGDPKNLGKSVVQVLGG